MSCRSTDSTTTNTLDVSLPQLPLSNYVLRVCQHLSLAKGAQRCPSPTSPVAVLWRIGVDAPPKLISDDNVLIPCPHVFSLTQRTNPSPLTPEQKLAACHIPCTEWPSAHATSMSLMDSGDEVLIPRFTLGLTLYTCDSDDGVPGCIHMWLPSMFVFFVFSFFAPQRFTLYPLSSLLPFLSSNLSCSLVARADGLVRVLLSGNLLLPRFQWNAFCANTSESFFDRRFEMKLPMPRFARSLTLVSCDVRNRAVQKKEKKQTGINPDGHRLWPP